MYGLNDSTLEAGVALIKLGAAGYAQVTALPGGLEGWKAGGGKIEQSAAPELPSGQFEVGLRAKLGEFKLKYEALAKDAGISEKRYVGQVISYLRLVAISGSSNFTGFIIGNC